MSCRCVSMLILLIALDANAQNKTIDSLLSLLPERDCELRFTIYCHLTFEYSDLVDESALAWIDSALSIPHLDSLMITKGFRIRSMALNSLNNVDDALTQGKKALEISLRNSYTRESARLYNDLGTIYTKKGEYKLAASSLYKSLGLKKSNLKGAGIGPTFNNIGLLYYKLKDYSRASQYFDSAKRNGSDSIIIMQNIALCQANMGQINLALDNLNKSVDGANRQGQPGLYEMTGDFSYGLTYFHKRDYIKAIQKFENSIALARTQSNHLFVADNLLYLSKVKQKILRQPKITLSSVWLLLPRKGLTKFY
jgi:tetratricopeptide (TPR) repeat protein